MTDAIFIGNESGHVGHFDFDVSDLVGVIIPTLGYGPLRYSLNERGIAAISPGMSYEDMFHALATQKRATRRIIRHAMKKQESE